MLIGTSPRRPSRRVIGALKRSLREALALSDDAVVTITELACREEGCAPVETVFGLLRPQQPLLRHTVHKPAADIGSDDLALVCSAWGFTASLTDIPDPCVER